MVNIPKLFATLIEVVSITYVIISAFSAKIVARYPEYKSFVDNDLVLVTTTILLILILIHHSIKENSISLNYRLTRNPSSLDLSMDDLKSSRGDTVDLYLENERNNAWLSLFSLIGLNLLLIIEYPQGIIVGINRETSEFKKTVNGDKRVNIYLSMPLDGLRRVSFDVGSSRDTTFYGKKSISTKIYISSFCKIFPHFLDIELGYCSINIQPARSS